LAESLSEVDVSGALSPRATASVDKVREEERREEKFK
jgi:hypothetical protein